MSYKRQYGQAMQCPVCGALVPTSAHTLHDQWHRSMAK